MRFVFRQACAKYWISVTVKEGENKMVLRWLVKTTGTLSCRHL